MNTLVEERTLEVKNLCDIHNRLLIKVYEKDDLYRLAFRYDFDTIYEDFNTFEDLGVWIDNVNEGIRELIEKLEDK